MDKIIFSQISQLAPFASIQQWLPQEPLQQEIQRQNAELRNELQPNSQESLFDKWKDEGLFGLAKELIKQKEEKDTLKKVEELSKVNEARRQEEQEAYIQEDQKIEEEPPYAQIQEQQLQDAIQVQQDPVQNIIEEIKQENPQLEELNDAEEEQLRENINEWLDNLNYEQLKEIGVGINAFVTNVLRLYREKQPDQLVTNNNTTYIINKDEDTKMIKWDEEMFEQALQYEQKQTLQNPLRPQCRRYIYFDEEEELHSYIICDDGEHYEEK